MFEQVRQALLTPEQLLAAERAVLTGAPDENELVAAQLGRLDTAIEAKERERARLLDAYQAGLLELEELTRRTGALATRRAELTREGDTQPAQRGAGRPEPYAPPTRWIWRRTPALDDLDFGAGRRRLMRLVVEKVSVTGWRVEIHLKIPLPNEPPPNGDRPDHRPSGPHPPTGPPRPNPPSSDLRLRSDHRERARASHSRWNQPSLPGHANLGITSIYLQGIDSSRSSAPSTDGHRRPSPPARASR